MGRKGQTPNLGDDIISKKCIICDVGIMLCAHPQVSCYTCWKHVNEKWPIRYFVNTTQEALKNCAVRNICIYMYFK